MLNDRRSYLESCLFRSDGGSRIKIHWHVARLGGDALEPGAYGRKRFEVVIAEMRYVSVGIQCDIGDGVTVGGKEVVQRDMLFHHTERAMAFLHPVLEGVALQVASALDQREPKISSAKIWLQAVLLEEHPLQRFRALGIIAEPPVSSSAHVPRGLI